MNAYELAQKIVSLKIDDKTDWAYRAYDMLRKQADRIAELEEQESTLHKTIATLAEEIVRLSTSQTTYNPKKHGVEQ